MTTKLLKSYKGYVIEKSYEEKADGTINKETVVFTAYTADEDLFDAKKTLGELKKSIDKYVKQHHRTIGRLHGRSIKANCPFMEPI